MRCLTLLPALLELLAVTPRERTEAAPGRVGSWMAERVDGVLTRRARPISVIAVLVLILAGAAATQLLCRPL